MTPENTDTTVSVEVKSGQIIGRYRVLKTLGRGGMGTVYLAERADQHYEQRVALKVMARGLFHGEPANRFRAERQILARLAHPNIARLLDGGQMDDGTPFLVMEHVEGVRIDDYCDSQLLSVRQRLQLVQQVCSAVQYAHQNLIVHRDIKPTNILVTADGTPKLLDFGIAKLLDPTNAGMTAPVTQVRDRMLTPEHASPEQFRGEPVGTVSDVYSLGSLLYELLSGVRPFNFANRSAAEMERMVSETSPLAPSARLLALADDAADPTNLRTRARGLAGDIDNIVLKAMHRDAERRYTSAAALAQDIQNYLDGLPVQARPDTWVYRTRKFLRRNAFEVTGALATAAVIAILVTFYTVKLSAERDAAERERQTANAVAEFMMDVFRRANPNESKGNTVTVREALDAAARRIDTDLADEPRLRITLMRNMSLAYNGLGLWPESRALLKKAVEQERTTFGNSSVELARSLEALGSTENNMSLFAEAGATLEQALAVRKALGADRDPEAIMLLSSIANNFRSQQQFAKAIEIHRQAEALARSLSPPNTRVLGQVLQASAMTYSESGDLQASEQYAREALPLVRGVVIEGHDMYVNVLNSLGTTLRRQFKLAEAEVVFREFIEIQTQKLGPDHFLVGRAQNNFSGLLRAKGDYAAAERALKDALRIYRLDPATNAFDIGIAYHNLGALYHEWGQLDQSLNTLNLAIDQKRGTAGPRSPQVVSSLLERAAVLRELDRQSDARQSFSEAKSIAAEKFDKNDRRHALLLLEQGRLELAERAIPEAERDLREAVGQLRQQDDPARLAEAIVSLGDAFIAAAKPADARAALTEALEIRKKILPVGHKAITDSDRRLAALAHAPID